MQLSKNLFYALLLIVLGNECAFGQAYLLKMGGNYKSYRFNKSPFDAWGGCVSVENRFAPHNSVSLDMEYRESYQKYYAQGGYKYFVRQTLGVLVDIRHYFRPEKSSFYVGFSPAMYVFNVPANRFLREPKKTSRFWGLNGKLGGRLASSMRLSLDIDANIGFYHDLEDLRRPQDDSEINWGFNMLLGYRL